MPDDPIRDHIEATAARPERETRRLTARIIARCWPGGGEDRIEPAALHWLRRWRPVAFGAAIPTCTCGSGHCPVCN
jgi:hypothetical protein